MCCLIAGLGFAISRWKYEVSRSIPLNNMMYLITDLILFYYYCDIGLCYFFFFFFFFFFFSSFFFFLYFFFFFFFFLHLSMLFFYAFFNIFFFYLFTLSCIVCCAVAVYEPSLSILLLCTLRCNILILIIHPGHQSMTGPRALEQVLHMCDMCNTIWNAAQVSTRCTC